MTAGPGSVATYLEIQASLGLRVLEDTDVR
jgi:hypothetical protein